MRKRKLATIQRRHRLLTAIFGCAILAGCAHRAPALHGSTALISGRATAKLDPADARHKVLIVAASITLDHGYRYFEILGPVRPGIDVRLHLYATGEINPGASGVWDADAVAAGQMK